MRFGRATVTVTTQKMMMKISHSVPLIYSTRRQRRLELEKWAASAAPVTGYNIYIILYQNFKWINCYTGLRTSNSKIKGQNDNSITKLITWINFKNLVDWYNLQKYPTFRHFLWKYLTIWTLTNPAFFIELGYGLFYTQKDFNFWWIFTQTRKIAK